MSSGLVLFSKPKTLTCSLGVSGEFPDYNPGEAYTGTVNITGATGATTVDLVSGTPPSGFTIDTITSPDRVRVQWPGIPVAPPSSVSLLNFNGTNGSTTFTDSANGSRSWTATNGAVLTTSNKKYGSAALSFPSRNSFVFGNSFSNIPQGTDYCLEMWVRRGGSASGQSWLFRMSNSSGISFVANSLQLYIGAGGDLTFDVANDSGSQAFTGGNLSDFSAFYHIAVSVQNDTANNKHIVRIFQDGVQQGSAAERAGPSPAVNASSGGVWLGNPNFGSVSLNGGQMDDFRLVVGNPVYTANFTPPVEQVFSTGTATSTLDNLNFESGDTSWIKGYGWTITNTGLADGGAWSAKYNGVGQSNLAHVTAAPVNPGTSITASCRVSKGANREDYAGGAVVLQWFDANLNPLGFNVGNVVNTGTSAFQTSSVTATAPTGAAFVRLAGSGTRDVKGRASDLVYLDSFSWNHTFALGGSGTGATPVTGPIPLTFRVRDSQGCSAVATRTIQYARDVEFALTGIANHTSPAGSTQVYNANIPADTQVGDTLLFYTYEVGGNSFNGVGTSGWTSIGRTTGSISSTGGITTRYGSGGGESMIARAQDVANGTVPVSLWAQTNTVIICIKIPAAMGVLNISTTGNQNANSATSGSGSSIATSGSISPIGGVSGNFYVFAFSRVLGGATFTGMPFSRRQATITGPGTTGNTGTAQSVAVCYNGVLNGNSFTGGTFTFTGAPASSTRMASMLILRTNAPVT